METNHAVRVGDSRDLTLIEADAVDLVVTSPPYPMIELWDDLFAELDPTIGTALEAGDGHAAFEGMHEVLTPVWDELQRVVAPGGIACINIGDATRRLHDHFEKYANAARITREMTDRGFVGLPDILWHKPTNSGTKFLGSGMLPPNAYVTLEHEYILIFRNGPNRRQFEPDADRRYEAAYFWEERNQWFSDVWTDITGVGQTIDEGARSRSAAYPLAIPYRLINMYSAYGDTVLDPFCGTGTTVLAAMVAARNSIGINTDSSLIEAFDPTATSVDELASNIGRDRLASHRKFVADHRATGGEFGYRMENYDMPVKTAQERRITVYEIDGVNDVEEGYRIRHSPITGVPATDSE